MGLQIGAKRLQIRAAFGITNWTKVELQIGAAFKITNWGQKITNRGRDYKIGAKKVQIRAGITNRCRTNLSKEIIVF